MRYARVAAATVPGAVHLRTGRPNQDAVAWLPRAGEGERVVMAVADGHGSACSPRSDLGAAFAVDIATKALHGLQHPAGPNAVTAALRQITAHWDARVRDHLDRHPLTAAELQRMGDGGAVVTNSERPGLLYGTTLLFAVVSYEQLTLGQLGDGDVLLVDGAGRVERPLPDDVRLVAHVTTSLSDDDPVASTRTRIVRAEQYRLVILATDGYANSFATDEDFLKVGRDVLRSVDDAGIVSLRASLPSWLAETTRQGAGDDIGVAIAVLDSPAVAPAHPAGT